MIFFDSASDRSVAISGRKIQRLGDLDGYPDFARHEGWDMMLPQCTLAPKQNVVKQVQDFILFQKDPKGAFVTVFDNYCTEICTFIILDKKQRYDIPNLNGQ